MKIFTSTKDAKPGRVVSGESGTTVKLPSILPGMLVPVAGRWFTVKGVTADGVLVLELKGATGWALRHRPRVGEMSPRQVRRARSERKRHRRHVQRQRNS